METRDQGSDCRGGGGHHVCQEGQQKEEEKGGNEKGGEEEGKGEGSKKNRRKGERRQLTQDDRISLAGTDLVVANITKEVRGECRGRGVFCPGCQVMGLLP